MLSELSIPPAVLVQTSFYPPRSPELKPSLAHLQTPLEKKSIKEVQSRVDQALLRRDLLLAAVKQQASEHNKRARAVAAQAKEQRAVAAANKMARLTARLDAAAQRRMSRHSSPLPSPEAKPAAKLTGEDHGDPFALQTQALVPKPLAHEAVEPEATEPEPLPLHAELMVQIAEANGEFSKLAQWIKEPATIGLVAEWLASLSIERTLAKKLLALVYMAHEAEQMFDDSDADQRMAREAARFKDKLVSQLKRGTKKAREETFEQSFVRARRFHAAWAAQDVPMQAKVVDEVLQRLHDAIMRRRVQHAHEGTEPVPPEDLLAQIRVLAGEVAEAAARAAFLRPWQPVARDELEGRVREAATRALWDVLKAQVAAGEYQGLFEMLGVLQQAMGALVAHSVSASEELVDRFDANWLKQRAEAGALETGDVHGLIHFVVERIAGWQAPIDDADTREWTAAVEATLASTGGMGLDAFISAHMIDVIVGAFGRVAKVYSRVLELSGQMESLREATSEVDEA